MPLEHQSHFSDTLSIRTALAETVQKMPTLRHAVSWIPDLEQMLNAGVDTSPAGLFPAWRLLDDINVFIRDVAVMDATAFHAAFPNASVDKLQLIERLQNIRDAWRDHLRDIFNECDSGTRQNFLTHVKTLGDARLLWRYMVCDKHMLPSLLVRAKNGAVIDNTDFFMSNSPVNSDDAPVAAIHYKNSKDVVLDITLNV